MGALVIEQQGDHRSPGPARLYRDLLDAWNRRDAAGMAALFAHDGSLVGFDGSQVDGGPPAVAAHLAPIFASHATPAYVGKVREVRTLAPKVSLVRAVAGMVPEGRRDLNPALNTIHTLVAVEAAGRGGRRCSRARRRRSTAGRIWSHALTEELRALLPKAPARRRPRRAPSAPMSGCRQHGAMDCRQPRQGKRAGAAALQRSRIARELAGEAGFELQQMHARGHGRAGRRPGSVSVDSHQVPRRRAVQRGPRSRGLHQVVILAAGMDTRAFRIPWPSGVKVFEVDRDEIFDHKEAVLGRAGASPSCERHVVRADLARPWAAALAAAGFERSKPAAFLVEGLLMYLEEAEALALLAAVGRHRGAWQLAGRRRGQSRGAHVAVHGALHDRAARGRQPVEVRHRRPRVVLQRSAAGAATVVQPGDPEASYGRWPFPTAPRAMPGLPRTFFVTADRTRLRCTCPRCDVHANQSARG